VLNKHLPEVLKENAAVFFLMASFFYSTFFGRGLNSMSYHMAVGGIVFTIFLSLENTHN